MTSIGPQQQQPEEQVPREISWPPLPLGLGTGRLCSLNGGVSISRAVRLMEEAADLGVRFIDTAPTYGQGQVETAIGRLPLALRQDLLICSKVGYSFGSKAQLINAAKPFLRPVLPWVGALRKMAASARHRAGSSGGSMTLKIEPASIREVLQGTLTRLRREHLDLLLLHDPSIESVNNPANQEELNRLRQEGKIVAWGVSTGDAEVAASAVHVPQCSVVQVPVFPDWVQQHGSLFQQCVDRDMPIIAHRVLEPVMKGAPGDAPSHNTSTAEECLAFARRQPSVEMVLCGTRQVKHLRKNVEFMRGLAQPNSSNTV